MISNTEKTNIFFLKMQVLSATFLITTHNIRNNKMQLTLTSAFSLKMLKEVHYGKSKSKKQKVETIQLLSQMAAV